ncbi:fatty acyl-CoA reductase wat-like [Diprion similis]|uniref:fatty acyl-CoA reductase wat-like n=1 Tax=Diprion similis TaxID=362088 RepID=UPI001EF768B1|nr:fatty acyl-CoA reductase wat-like [Diprion similis]
MSEIREFFAGRNIFVTGGTGFIGKGLVEKLLRSCEEIGTVYLLVRGKKGKTAEERFDSLLLEPVFDVLRTSSPDFSKKIVAIPGDITSEGLGLSAEDHQRIVDEVSVIFHIAATVHFNERLDKAIPLNVNGVKYVLDIAKACKNLAVGIHVSTAYSHCVSSNVEEKICAPPLSFKEANDLCDNWKMSGKSEYEIKSITKSVLKGWPNTYTFTKAIGEGVVAEFAGELPFAIFRPSIVINSYNEPMPGWISGFTGLPAMLIAIGLGINHVGLIDKDMRLDIVPVDYTCNAIISSAWETAITKRRDHQDIPVYHYVSNNEQPITWEQFEDHFARSGRENPTVRAIYYPCSIQTKSKFFCGVVQLFLHFLPALIIDNVARLLGKQLRLYELAMKIWNAAFAFEYFTTRQWDFNNDRVQNLWQRIGPTDQKEFPFSMKNVNWETHSKHLIAGLKKYLLKDHSGSEEGKRRCARLVVHHPFDSLFHVLFLRSSDTMENILVTQRSAGFKKITRKKAQRNMLQSSLNMQKVDVKYVTQLLVSFLLLESVMERNDTWCMKHLASKLQAEEPRRRRRRRRRSKRRNERKRQKKEGTVSKRRGKEGKWYRGYHKDVALGVLDIDSYTDILPTLSQDTNLFLQFSAVVRFLELKAFLCIELVFNKAVLIPLTKNKRLTTDLVN